MTRLFVIVLMIAASAAWADIPGLYSVNPDAPRALRENPRATSVISDRLPDERDTVEVTELSDNGDWARILHGEGNAWMPLDALSALETTGGRFENPLYCAGTEPFWTLRTENDALVFDEMGEPSANFEVQTRATSGNTTAHELAVADSLSVIVRAAACSDGMTDRSYGLSVNLVLRGAQTQLLSGCCTLQAQ
ncbi:MAG: hypothetical protein AAF848_05395 [Pseudomonadota bacterium]